MNTVNIHQPDFDDSRDEPGFSARRARVGHQVGTRRLGASLWEIDPGDAAYPYHAHLGEEELVVILDGRPSLRTPGGWRDVEPGEVLRFPPGDAGAHQLVNRSDAVVQFLAISTQDGPDIVLQPDSGKLGAYERLAEGGGRRAWFRCEDEVGYFEGERAPDEPRRRADDARS